MQVFLFNSWPSINHWWGTRAVGGGFDGVFNVVLYSAPREIDGTLAG